VIGNLSNWLDHRTGFRKLVSALLIEHIPGGAKWRYVWGSTLAFVFAVQLITGVLLMTAYSPGSTTAWSSVYFIQYEMDFGWLIRGLHHFGSQTMVVLLGVHMLQVVIAGAHLPPREINWWLGLGLLGLVLALSLTGYLLPWDQKGYWATKVATNIAGNLPVIGPWLSKIVVGGPEYGNHTLTRFYTLHVGVLPPLVILLTIGHLTVFRRHGVTHGLQAADDNTDQPLPTKGDGWFWPDQAFRDMLVSMVIFAVMLGLVIYGHGHKLEPPAQAASLGAPPEGAAAAEPTLYERWAHAGRDGRGANLDAPADPGVSNYPARPEWYFLFLFQLLKYFEGEQELIGTVIIPNAAMLLLAALPLLAFGQRRGPVRKMAHVVGILVIVSLLGGAAVLTGLALASDRQNAQFQQDLEKADKLGQRAVQVAHEGIPAQGAVVLLRNDPKTRGPELFTQYCGSCHTHGSGVPNEKPTASDLEGFGTRAWTSGLLQDPSTPHYFGNTGLKTMSTWVKARRVEARSKEQEGKLDADFDRIAGWLADHPGRDKARDDQQPGFAEGLQTFTDRKCMTCHVYNGDGETKGPELTGYGDAEWLRLMIMAPEHPARYGSHNRMPIFRDLESPLAEVHRQEVRRGKDLLLKDAEDDKAKTEVESATKLIHLSDTDREVIIRWLLKDYRVVFGGEPVAAAPNR
jgi:ubiquinol-cytochrome c reductase cytochrome b subunit